MGALVTASDSGTQTGEKPSSPETVRSAISCVVEFLVDVWFEPLRLAFGRRQK